ncbi:MAG: Serine-tRNA ligase [Candidatus Woesebacteria bacterium GW2011_GWB1_38_5b]|uniref:Serine--tRNA ligase n=1 Tax=Candidatus Woesebacteria bacterium GW2011_GWB1_38_5b TaxID=1618569 RepID=A0A0G0MM73_9BACT|nr:MAG: Serine-tRNA ligase [Candidatus Woesebacteria bacterium GW2011_GWB1_38_5b]OGH47210.1 MAG: serine--tRNA ligase [Candidatus Levybacteria bacterium RIFCSPLOWO2_01_FULL_39_10]
MFDIKYIRENPERVEKAAKDKGVTLDLDEILEIDKKTQILRLAQQKLLEERNKAAKHKDKEKGKKIKEEIEELEKELLPLEKKLKELLLSIPNIAKSDVKSGKDETENEVIKKVGDIPKFDFEALDHMDLGESLDIIDVDRASRVSGTRFAYLKNEAVLLEFALVSYALQILTKEGFIPVVPPTLVNTEVMRGLGYMEAGGSEDMFHIPSDKLTLVGTAEHSIVPMHMGEVLNVKDLPKRYVGFSSAFRREAGSYGKDTRGILRVHQFDKVEMVSFVEEGKDDKEHEYLLSLEEKLFQALEIPYRVVKMCTGDLGFPAARKYDIEAWMPGQKTYREVTSVSTVTSFQSRRLKIRYQDNGERKYVNILNGTAFAIGRTIIAILENYQNKDRSIAVPDALQKYMFGVKKISLKKG